MGRKAKIGKQRKDKYYSLAKETGFRSRAAFKLIQLNNKFDFLSQSQVLIDLCAAPGGWLQVASQYMPVSSLIIGVDLVSIKPLHNVIAIQDDITKESCKSALRKQLQTWSADCVLHDGAPNVGKNWHYDAFAQAQLVLHALKLASTFLRPGGWFITKVFRSKDYQDLMKVFGRLFEKVHATKPKASRTESAEMFVVCKGFIKPEKLDPTIFNAATVFTVDPAAKPKISLLNPEKRRTKAQGYGDNEHILFHKASATEFVQAENHMDLLAKVNEIYFDEEFLRDYPAPSEEVKACCKDIKVLGRKELRAVLNWRRDVRKAICAAKAKQAAAEAPEEEVKSEEEEDKALDTEIQNALLEQKSTSKRKKKILAKQRREYQRKVDRKMVIPGDKFDSNHAGELFSLETLRKTGEETITDVAKALKEVNSADLSETNENEDYDAVGLTEEDTKLLPVAHSWFEKDVFNEVENDDDEDLEVEVMAKKMKLDPDQQESDAENHPNTIPSYSESGSSDEEEVPTTVAAGSSQGAEMLTPEELALGELYVHSSKSRKDLIEFGFNRYANNDDGLPDWFVEEEKQYCRPNLPVSKELVEKYKLRLREINARPIKKVAEAKARKKKRALRQLEKAKKKAEGILESEGLTEAEKAKELRKIYRKADPGKQKREVTYVVSKKGLGRRVRRPPGVKGRFKLVDRRLKKDKRSQKTMNQRQKQSRKPR